jgi:hypothetical protein
MVAASGTREHLLAAGVRSAREVVVTPAGDEMTFLRDSWGVTLQLVRRATLLLAGCILMDGLGVDQKTCRFNKLDARRALCIPQPVNNPG